MSFAVAIDLSHFYEARDRTLTELREGLARAVEEAARQGAAEAKTIGRFQDRTGDLRRHIHAEKVIEAARDARWKIVSPMPYSIFVELPTRPHEIWPKASHGVRGPLREGQTRRASGQGPHEHIVGRGQFLRWKSGGRTFFARMVHHPGTPGFPYMGPALLKAERVLWRDLELLRLALGTVWRQAA